MKSYTESKNKTPFDWNEFLAQGSYTQRELNKAAKLSGNWVTCACGTMCSILDRDNSGRPKDDALENLGCEFATEVDDMRSFNERITRYMGYLETEKKRDPQSEYLDYYKKEIRENVKIFETSRKKAMTILAKIEKRSMKLLTDKFDALKESAQHFGFKLVKRKKA